MPKHPSTTIHDLDDGVLLRIMSHLNPLPDGFQFARCCKRLHSLNSDPRLWLTVINHPLPSPCPPTVYTSLADAVAASRPGDTIIIQPGIHMVHEVVVQWPLRICGAGGLPEHTVLRAPKGVDYAIDFFAAAMLVNVKVESCRSCAVIHSKGRLYLERCMLSCETQGLDHLLTPLQTRARVVGEDDASQAGHPERDEEDENAQGGCTQQDTTQQNTTQQNTTLQLDKAVATLKASLAAVRARGTVPTPAACSPCDSKTCNTAGKGHLIVSECVLQGGLQAVGCVGSGSVANVRVIQHTNAKTWFWFDVDATACTQQGVCPPQTPCLNTGIDSMPCGEYEHVCGEELDARAACHACVAACRVSKR